MNISDHKQNNSFSCSRSNYLSVSTEAQMQKKGSHLAGWGRCSSRTTMQQKAAGKFERKRRGWRKLDFHNYIFQQWYCLLLHLDSHDQIKACRINISLLSLYHSKHTGSNEVRETCKVTLQLHTLRSTQSCCLLKVLCLGHQFYSPTSLILPEIFFFHATDFHSPCLPWWPG